MGGFFLQEATKCNLPVKDQFAMSQSSPNNVRYWLLSVGIYLPLRGLKDENCM